MSHEYPGFTPPIAQLFGLAIAPFDAGSSNDNLWSFPFDPCGETRLIFAVGAGLTEVVCTILSICWWEAYLRMQHPTDEGFAAGRSEFDRRFDEATAATVALLGPPLLSGSHPDGGYRHSAWRSRTGLLIVQQSDYDCQFGGDVDSWVERWPGPDPKPTSPFIDRPTWQSGA